MKYKCALIAPALLMFLLAVHIPSALAQSTPFLSDSEIRMLVNEISGDRAFEHIRWMTHWHRRSASEGFFKAADYILEAAKTAGLEDVRFVEQPALGPSYKAITGELWMVEPVEVKLADIGDHTLYLADYSRDADVTAELVWIGDGSEKMLSDRDVSGKIVLTTGTAEEVVRKAVWEKGAVGVVSYQVSEGRSPMDYPDQISWQHLPADSPEGKPDTFAFVLPVRKGVKLRRVLETTEMQDFFATGTRSKGGRVVLKAKVDTEIGETPGKTGFVEGWIRGSKYHDQQIVLTAHIQEEQGSANDDASGCANLLESARVLNKLITEGRMERPLRDIRFWWTDEIYSEYRYFSDHPEDSKNLLANINQDMVGAKQSVGSRVQHLIFAPHSRTSFLDAVFESIGTYLLETNNSFLASGRQGGLPRPHSRPVYATRGSREGYRATFVPYFNSSDQMCFVDGIIGVPAVALINWDDNYIHSTDDDIDKIDQTQLQRNNFLVSATAYVLSEASQDDVPTLTGETFAQGGRRLAKDLTAAIQQINDPSIEKETAWKDAHLLIEQGMAREVRALDSARVFADGDEEANRLIETLITRMKHRQAEMMADLTDLYRTLHGKAPQKIKLTAEEEAARKKIPVNPASLATYFANRRKVQRPKTLHELMRDEVYNFVDGQRTYYEIYKATRAEALATGSWYYWEVRLADVVALLDAAVEVEALQLK